MGQAARRGAARGKLRHTAKQAVQASALQVGATERVRWKGYPSKLLHAAAFRVAKTP